MDNIIINLAKITTALVALKAITGFHFPWKKCSCCDKRYKEHVPVKER